MGFFRFEFSRSVKHVTIFGLNQRINTALDDELW